MVGNANRCFSYVLPDYYETAFALMGRLYLTRVAAFFAVAASQCFTGNHARKQCLMGKTGAWYLLC